VSEKDDSYAISSDGEFLDAQKMEIYDEDDSYINLIENDPLMYVFS
jgi:hypothetical protein